MSFKIVLTALFSVMMFFALSIVIGYIYSEVKDDENAFDKDFWKEAEKDDDLGPFIDPTANELFNEISAERRAAIEEQEKALEERQEIISQGENALNVLKKKLLESPALGEFLSQQSGLLIAPARKDPDSYKKEYIILFKHSKGTDLFWGILDDPPKNLTNVWDIEWLLYRIGAGKISIEPEKVMERIKDQLKKRSFYIPPNAPTEE